MWMDMWEWVQSMPIFVSHTDVSQRDAKKTSIKYDWPVDVH